MKIPDGWFLRLVALGRRFKADAEALAAQPMSAETLLEQLGKPDAPTAGSQLFDQYADELGKLARELQAETEKEQRAAKVAELAAVILSGTLLGNMDREAVIKAAAVARQLLDEAAGVKELPS